MSQKQTQQPRGKIYLVPVPIGNLGDITLRALEVLKSVELIAAEDTRQTRFLLSHYNIAPPRLISFHKFNERSREQELLSHLENGKDLGVVSDAGTPGISDPAMGLVSMAIAHQIDIVALPGATAFLPALTASGLHRGQFTFLGFLPLKPKARQAELLRIRDSLLPCIVYEAPHRVQELIRELYELCGARKASLARELTKLHEEYVRSDLQKLSGEGSFRIQGEFVLIIDAAPAGILAQDKQAEELIRQLLDAGVSPKDLVKIMGAALGFKRNQVYELLLKIQKERELLP